MFNKRYQVLLSDWMEEYCHFLANKYDLNMSSTIRVFMCLGMIRNVSMVYPEFKTDLDSKQNLAATRKAANKGIEEEDAYRMMSKILYESRKAVEYRFAKEKKKKNK